MLQETKIKGLTTELQCQLFFTQMGYNISIPIGEDCRYDFILDCGKGLLRVQVKTCKEDDTGIVFSVCSSHLNAQGNVSHPYTKEDIDVFATFYNNQCYLVPVEDCGIFAKKLLFTKNSKMQKGAFIEDYLASKILNEIKPNEEIKAEKKISQTTKDISFKKEVITIKQFSLDGEFLNEYSNFAEASRAIGAISGGSHISEAAKGKRKTAYGFLWKVEVNKE